MQNTPPKNKKNPIIIIVFILSLLVFLVSGLYLANYFWQANQASREFEGLAGLVDKVPVDSGSAGTPEEVEMNGYKKLHTLNPDFIGWLAIEGTRVDYPVVQAANNDYYLRRNFEKEYSLAGIPFMDFRNDLSLKQSNVIIYGHNMKSGDMFNDIEKYRKRDFYLNHSTVSFNTLTEDRQYEVFAVFYASVALDDPNTFEYYNFIDADSAEAFDGFIKNVRRISFYDTGITPQYGDELLTLSTCDNVSDEGRIVLMARRLKE